MKNNWNDRKPKPRKLPDYMSQDAGDGFVYLVEAKGFHGILSPIKKRLKIGLSNNPERRLRELNSEQAPCQIVGIRYIKVMSNATVETRLHKHFARNRRHGEWFDFWVWELPLVNRAYDRAKHDNNLSGISLNPKVIQFVAIATGAMAIVVVVAVITSAISI